MNKIVNIAIVGLGQVGIYLYNELRLKKKEIEIKTGKKKWWKIWRKTLGTPDYYKLEKEVDANLQGLYLKAKKSRTPL